MKRLSLPTKMVAVLLYCTSLQAQTNNYKYEFGINAGFLVYQGDLTPNRLGSFKTQKFSLGIHAGKILSSHLSARAQLFFGKLKGDESVYSKPEYRQQRNFNFTSPITELSANIVYNIAGKNYTDKGFSPFLFTGLGLSLVKINRDWSNTNISYFGTESSEFATNLATDIAHKTPRLLPVIPIGAGVKYFFSQRLAANAETAYRLSNTDYLDGFSHSANPGKKDHYLNYSIGIIYRTGKKDKLGCPTLKY